MAYTAGFSVSVGDPTKASDVTTLAANDDFLKAAVDAIMHDSATPTAVLKTAVTTQTLHAADDDTLKLASTSFVKRAADAAGISFSNDADNRVVTGTGSGINGEANLTFDGSVLAVTGAVTMANAAGPTIVNEAATATNPTLIPNKAEVDTGYGWASADTLTAITGGAERMRIDNAGNVGIGTNSPVGVGGTIADIKGSGTNGASLSMGTTTAVTNARLYSISAYSGTTECVRIETGTEGGANDAGAMSFSTRVASGALTSRMRVGSDGAVTMPAQPAFFAGTTNDIDNVTGDGTAYTVLFPTEQFDTGGDYATGTGIFTAPVAGRYQFNAVVWIGGLTSSHTTADLSLKTSDCPAITFAYLNPYAFGVGGTDVTYGGSCIIDMDAADTAEIVFSVFSGAKVCDVRGSGGATSPRSHFSGFLVG